MNICGIMKVTLLDFPEHVACTVFTGGCNFRCPFCYNSGLVLAPPSPVMSEDEFFSFLHKRAGRLDGVAISGGEPTLEPDLKDFIKRIRSECGMKVKLDTNGTHPGVVEDLIAEGLIDYIAMDIKSGPSGYSRAVGIDISPFVMEAVRETKDLLMGGGTDYEFRTTVVGGIHAEADFYEIAEFISGARRYFLQRFTMNENVLDRSGGFYSPSGEELERYLEIVRPAVAMAAIRGVD